jgi:hypothetical protein
MSAHSESAKASDAQCVSLTKSAASGEVMEIHGHYDVVCIGEDGVEKWRDTIENLVVTVGKNDMLDKYFAGSTYTAAWYMGLVDGGSTPTYNAADTLASHAGWTESTAYSGTNRITVGWNSASAGSKASTTTAFSINGTATIAGALLTVTQLRATTTGVLYSAGNFTGGNRSVINGDTLNVTYTATLT